MMEWFYLFSVTHHNLSLYFSHINIYFDEAPPESVLIQEVLITVMSASSLVA